MLVIKKCCSKCQQGFIDHDFYLLIDMKNEQDDSDADLPKHKDKEYDRNILKRAQRTFIFLEHQSLVDMLEADGEYIVSAG